MLTFSTAATRRWAARLPVFSRALKSAILLIAVVLTSPVMAGDFFVATTGSDSNPGTLARPFKSLPKAVRVASAGDTIYLRGGTYALSSGIKLSKSGSIGYRINIFAYQAEVPVLDGSAMTQTAYNGGWVLWLADASWLHINGLEIRNGPMGGVVVTGASSNNILERLNVHHNGRLSQWEGTGISLYGSSANNLLINNDAHHNVDLQKSYADGFRISTSGTGNVLRGNRAWRNSDDGYDFFNIFKSAFNAPLLLENNWAYENGFDDEMRPTAGDGNGFQLGGRRDDGNGNSGGHTLNNNLSWRNRVDGFYENNASDALTLINNSAYNNGQWNYAFWTTPHVFYNNLSSGSMGVSICCGASRSVADHNSWTLPVAVSAADFLSLDSSLATGPRAGNGELPDTNFLRLAPTSDLIDKGVNVGLAYAGQKPDLGAYEASGVRPAGSAGKPIALAASASTTAPKDAGGDRAKATEKVVPAKAVNTVEKATARTEPKPTPATKTPAASAAAMFDAPGWPDFDIRLSDEKADHAALERMRDVNPAGRLRAQAARDQRHEAQRAMEARTQKLHIIESRETGAPEVIGPARGKRTLTGPRTGPRERIARDFLEVNAAAYGLSRAEAARLVKDADYANPAGNLHWVRLQQRINNRPVFRGEVTVAMTPTGEIARTTGQLAVAIDEREAPKTPVFSAAAAVSEAASKIGVNLAPAALVQIANTGKDDGSVSFQRGPFTDEIKAELMYFPLGDGSVDLAWSTVLWTKEAAYWSIVGASSGERLFQKNLSSSVVNTYSVYPSDSPAPMSPGPVDPTLGTQGVIVARSLLAIDELSTTMNDPWLGAGVTVTDGNNVEAGLDIDGTNGVDFPVGATAANTFNYAYNPAPGNPAPADAPTTAGSRNGAVVNLFYLTNRYHDQLYDLGFTEAARNFQADNYGRGGVGGDRISAEAQDSSGTNNANFNTPADGGRGRMQMYLWTGPTPDRDGDLDAEVVYHELTHGTSNRLHGNASGLSTNMARGMGEGWSDFYAEALLSEPTDPINGIYTTGGYATYEAVAGFTGNYYYGIRRFPRAPISFLGSNGKPHNPLLFSDIDSTQARDLNTIGAFPRGPFGVATLDQVHNLGEIWSSALWEARAKLVTAHGHAVGNTAMLQNVTDGMKLDPVGPTFLQARDSIIAADCAANAGVNEKDIWAAFAARGMGLNAQVLNAGTGGDTTRVLQDFTGPTTIETGAVSYVNTSCGLPGRNPIPGETVDLTVGLTNPFCSQTFTNVLVAAQGGGSDAVGTLAAGASTTATVPYTIPAETPCGSTVAVTIDITHDQGAQSLDYDLPAGPQATTTVSFSNATPISIPATGTIGVASLYPSPITVSGVTAPVVGVTLTLTGFTHSWFSDADFLLVAPDGKKMVVQSDAWNSSSNPTTLTMDLTLSDDAAAAMPSSGSPANTSPQSFKPTNHGASDAFAAPAPAAPFIEPQPAGSSTFASAFAGIDPNGTWNLYIVDDVSGDVGAISGGWTLGVVVTEPAICTACGGASLGGTVSGLAPGNEVVLQDNGGDDLTVSADGSFAFATPPAEGAAYDVTVLTQPTTPNQTCLVVNGSGTMPATSVTDIEVNCTTNTYTVGGSVSGMGAGNSVTLLNNGGDDLTVSANGAFTFATSVADGGAYAVTVQSSIAVGTQTCVVDGGTGSGNVAGADVTSVSVTCTPNTYTVGGDVSGLAAGNSVDLQNNGGDDLTVSADGSFTFTTAINDLGAYDATVSAQPSDPNQTCVVSNGSGFLAGANVTNVSVDCTTNSYTVGGTLSGLGAGNSITLRNSGGDDLVVNSDGSFAFATGVTDGGGYAVTIFVQPTSPDQTCAVTNDTGTIAGADVTDVTVTCKYITQVSVTGYNVTYDGLPHTATGAALDVDGNPLAGLDLSATTHTNVGVTNDAWTFTSPNANYTDDSGSVSDEIGKATLTVTADNLSRFFLDANPPLTYTITGFVNNETAAVISGTPDCTTTANPASPLGPYPITCTVGTLSATNYEFVFVAGTLNVLPRSALVNYIGQTTWVTSGSKSTTAQVTLSASVQDVTGVALVGATVSFKDLGTGKYLATNVKVAPVANAPGTGTANTIVTLSSGQYGAESYLILVEMTGGYDNTLQPAGDKTAVVAVAKPAATNQTIGIGSFAALSSAAGTFKGNGDDVGYTIGLSYTKSGANLKGKVTISVPQADGVLWIKSNAISSMAAVTATNPKTSTIYTKATVYKATPAGVVTIDGNVSLRIDAVDGSPDKVGVTVLSSKDSTLYYSNQWLLVPTGGQSVWKTVPETVINAPPTTVSTVAIQ